MAGAIGYVTPLSCGRPETGVPRGACGQFRVVAAKAGDSCENPRPNFPQNQNSNFLKQ